MRVVQAGQSHRTGQPGSGAGRSGCCTLVLHCFRPFRARDGANLLIRRLRQSGPGPSVAGPCAGPTFHSRPPGTGVVRRHGSSFGSFRRKCAALLTGSGSGVRFPSEQGKVLNPRGFSGFSPSPARAGRPGCDGAELGGRHVHDLRHTGHQFAADSGTPWSSPPPPACFRQPGAAPWRDVSAVPCLPPLESAPPGRLIVLASRGTATCPPPLVLEVRPSLGPVVRRAHGPMGQEVRDAHSQGYDGQPYYIPAHTQPVIVRLLRRLWTSWNSLPSRRRN